MNLLTKDSKEYAKCNDSQDPLKLWNALQTSHSQVGREVSDEELRTKKKELESLKQWDKRGNVASLEDHDRAWQDLYEEATHIGVDWEEKEPVRLYLSSVDSTHIAHDLSSILKSGAADFPKTVVDASYWVASTAHRNKLISESRPGKRGTNKELTANFMRNNDGKASTGTHPQCLFCKKNHEGGAQQCTRLMSLIKDKPDIVGEYTKMQAKKHQKGSGNYSKGNATEKKRKPPGSSRNHPNWVILTSTSALRHWQHTPHMRQRTKSDHTCSTMVQIVMLWAIVNSCGIFKLFNPR